MSDESESGDPTVAADSTPPPGDVGGSAPVLRRDIPLPRIGARPQALIVALAVEVACLVVLDVLLAFRAHANIPFQVLHPFAMAPPPPGLSVTYQLDWPRLAGFAALSIIVGTLLVLSILSARKLLEEEPTDQRTRRLLVIRITIVVSCGLALAEFSALESALEGWNPSSTLDVGTPDRWQTTSVLVVGGLAAVAVVAFGIPIIRNVWASKMTPLAWVTVAAASLLVIAGFVASQEVAVSTSYQYIHEVTADPGPNTHSIMGSSGPAGLPNRDDHAITRHPLPGLCRVRWNWRGVHGFWHWPRALRRYPIPRGSRHS